MRTDKAKLFLHGLLEVWRSITAIVRWTAVAVFSVLFLAGLLLRLPWKILFLLTVIPVVGLFVPRERQKWVWGAFTLVAAGVYLWIFFLPAHEESGWSTYQYIEEPSPEFLTNPENAAVHYVDFFQQYEEEVFSYPYSTSEDQATYEGPWDARQFPDLSDWMDRRKPALETLIGISRMPLCRFEAPITLRSYQRLQLRIKLMKAWASVLIRSAHRDLAAGDSAAALEKQLTIWAMARHLYMQGTLLDQATAFHLQRSGCRVLHSFIIRQDPPDSMLEEILSRSEQLDSNWPENWPRILRREKRLAGNFAGLFYQVHEQGQSRISRDLGQGLHEALGHPPYRFLRRRELSRLLALSMWLSLPASPEGIESMIERRFDRYAQIAEAGKDLEFVDTWPIWMRGLNYRSVIDWYAKQQVSFYYPLRQKNIQYEALERVTRLLVELKRYQQSRGTWPRQLEDLLGGTLTGGRLFDPVSERVFRYERTGDAFRLYSLGSNQRDDGGVNNGEDKGDRLYWPMTAWQEESEAIESRVPIEIDDLDKHERAF